MKAVARQRFVHVSGFDVHTSLRFCSWRWWIRSAQCVRFTGDRCGGVLCGVQVVEMLALSGGPSGRFRVLRGGWVKRSWARRQNYAVSGCLDNSCGPYHDFGIPSVRYMLNWPCDRRDQNGLYLIYATDDPPIWQVRHRSKPRFPLSGHLAISILTCPIVISTVHLSHRR